MVEACADPKVELKLAGGGFRDGKNRDIKGVYITLCSRHIGILQLQIKILDIAAVDVLGMCNAPVWKIRSSVSEVERLLYASAWALTLSVRFLWACKSLDMWNGQQWIPRFFVSCVKTLVYTKQLRCETSISGK